MSTLQNIGDKPRRRKLTVHAASPYQVINLGLELRNVVMAIRTQNIQIIDVVLPGHPAWNVYPVMYL